jgi:hypothetical protein
MYCDGVLENSATSQGHQCLSSCPHRRHPCERYKQGSAGGTACLIVQITACGAMQIQRAPYDCSGLIGRGAYTTWLPPFWGCQCGHSACDAFLKIVCPFEVQVEHLRVCSLLRGFDEQAWVGVRGKHPLFVDLGHRGCHTCSKIL